MPVIINEFEIIPDQAPIVSRAEPGTSGASTRASTAPSGGYRAHSAPLPPADGACPGGLMRKHGKQRHPNRLLPLASNHTRRGTDPATAW